MFPENGFAHPEIPSAELGLWMIPSPKADYFPAIIEERGLSALTAQLIPEDPALWRLEAYRGFLSSRRQKLAEAVNHLLAPS
jgi:hypothetical protein